MENTICQLSNPKNILAADGLKKFRQWKNLNKKIHASQQFPPPPKKNSIPCLFVNLSPTYILNEVMHNYTCDLKYFSSFLGCTLRN